MSKKCPPGVVCVENISLTIFIILGIIIIYLGYNHFNNSNAYSGSNSSSLERQNKHNFKNSFYNSSFLTPVDSRMSQSNMGLNPFFNFGYSNNSNDVLLNPYAPPLRDDRLINMDIRGPIPSIPINIQTQGFDTNYRQVGILTRINGPETILSLMGRPLYSNRDKWQFYTMSDKHNSVKLPVTHKQRSCTSDTGCDNIYNGDTVFVEGYNDAFKATVYDNAVQRYLPFV